jgi:hypothetical protein
MGQKYQHGITCQGKKYLEEIFKKIGEIHYIEKKK